MPIIIKRVSAVDFLGLSAATVEPKQPVVIVAGDNGAGKTSLYQAIRLALFNELPRVDLKRDAAELVRGSAAKGTVKVDLDDFGVDREFAVSVPGKRTGDDEPVNPVLGLCLTPHLFLDMPPQDRVTAILAITGVKMTPDVVCARLTARGVPAPVVSALSPLLTLGFEKCVDHAGTQATEARGAWKQLTGEAYGSVKAATWKPAAAGELPDAPMNHAEAVEKHATAARHRATLEANRQTNVAHNDRAAKDKVIAARLVELEASVKRFEAGANAPIEAKTLECPACNASLVLTAAGALEAFVPSPIPTVPPATKQRAQGELTNARRDLAAAREAAARLAAPPELPPAPTNQELQEAVDNEKQAADVLSSISRQHDAYMQALAAREKVDDVVAKARARHADVQAWTMAAEALSPAGIPSELMAQAMAPLRQAIKRVCSSDFIESWPVPEIADDGALSCWGRPLHLLSESEVYRVGLILAAAMASMTKIGTIGMDRADVLSPPHRQCLIGWLLDLADLGELAQAWVFITLKAAPKIIDGVETHWFEAGAVS